MIAITRASTARLLRFALASALVATPAFAQGFVERAAAVGLDFTFGSGLDRIGNLAIMTDWVQQGIAVGDITGDGMLDLVVAGNVGGTKVFRNDGGTFTDITATAGVDTPAFDNAPALGDYDGDGDLDLFLAVYGPGDGPTEGESRLYRNDGTGQFTEVTALSTTEGLGHSIFGKWFDYDYDGDLDLYVAEFNGTPNQYYINNGDGSFTERGAELGADIGGSTHIVAIADFDGDKIVDMLVGNDWRVGVLVNIGDNSDDFHLRGLGDGSFADVTVDSGFPVNLPEDNGSSTMGMTIADVDYDGDFDVYKTELDTQFLLTNYGWPTGAAWVRDQDTYGVANEIVPDPDLPGMFGPTVGWGCAFFDADFDLWIDLFKVNGHVSSSNPRNQRNYFFHGDGPGAGFTFSDQTAAFGLLDEFDDRGLAIGDMDDDGDIDILIAPPADKLRYFENQIPPAGQGWLKVEADTRTSAPGGYGTVVSFTDSLSHPHMRSIAASSPTASQNEAVAYFGLGTEASVDLTVEFPSGMTKTLLGVQPNQRLVVVEPEMIRLNRTSFGSSQPAGIGSGTSAGGAGLPKPPTGELQGAPTKQLRRTQLNPRHIGQGLSNELVVTAFAHDAAGNPLDETADVEIEVPGLTPIGGVRHIQDNVFLRRFKPNAAPGAYRVSVSFDGFDVRIRPTVQLVGPVSFADSTILVSPEAVRGGTADTFTVTFAPKDANGYLLGKGHDLEVEVPGFGGIPPTPMQDLGDGQYQLTLTAPVAVGHKLINVYVDGVLFQDAERLDVATSRLAFNSVFYLEDPHPNIALQRHQLKFKVTPRDLFGFRTGPMGSFQVNIFPNVGTQPVYLRTDLTSIKPNGEYCFILERAPTSPIASARGNFEVVIEGVTVISTPYQF